MLPRACTTSPHDQFSNVIAEALLSSLRTCCWNIQPLMLAALIPMKHALIFIAFLVVCAWFFPATILVVTIAAAHMVLSYIISTLSDS